MGRGGEPHHQVAARDLGSLDQNIQLIRAPLFHVSHRFDDVSHCWKSSRIHMLPSANTVLNCWLKALLTGGVGGVFFLSGC